MLTGIVRARPRAAVFVAILVGMAVGLSACGDTTAPGNSTSPPVQPPAAPTATIPLSESAPSEAAPDGWSTFTAEADGFAVDMPGEPQYITRTMDSALGELTFHFFQVTDGSTYYGVSYNDYPAEMTAEDLDSDSILDDAISSAGGGEAQNVQRIEMQGHPGIEGEMEVQGTTHAWYRSVLAKNRLYQLIATAPEADKDAFAGKAARFINSFTLLNP